MISSFKAYINNLWRCLCRCLCRRRFLNYLLLAKGELRDYLPLHNSLMPRLGSLLLDQPQLKLFFPKQRYIPANSSRPGTWRVVVTLKIPLSCNFSTSSVWLKVFRLLPCLYQVIWGRGRPLNIHFTPRLMRFSRRKIGEPHRVAVSGPKVQESGEKKKTGLRARWTQAYTSHVVWLPHACAKSYGHMARAMCRQGQLLWPC